MSWLNNARARMRVVKNIRRWQIALDAGIDAPFAHTE